MNSFVRYCHSLFLMFVLGGGRKADYIKRHQLFGAIGEHCSIQSWRLPLYPKLIFIHDNVIVATDVRFVVHDAIFNMLNNKYKDFHFIEKVGCIEIMNNVFIGSGTRILNDVRIGNNVIIGAGSLVNKDIPDNSVFAGIPAKYICSFDDYVKKSRQYSIDFKKLFGVDSVSGKQEVIFQELYSFFCKTRET